MTPLHDAARKGNTEMVQWLVIHGADVNARTRDGLTPLRLANIWKQPAIAKYLSEQGGKE